MYWDDKYGTETVNQDVLKQMKNSMMDNTNTQHNSFLLDDDSGVNLSLEEILGSSMEITLDFESKSDLPEELSGNDAFEFLTTKLTAQ